MIYRISAPARAAPDSTEISEISGGDLADLADLGDLRDPNDCCPLTDFENLKLVGIEENFTHFKRCTKLELVECLRILNDSKYFRKLQCFRMP